MAEPAEPLHACTAPLAPALTQVHRGRASGTTAVPQLRASWDKRLQERAERAAVMAAQAEVDETIRKEKQALGAPPLLCLRNL